MEGSQLFGNRMIIHGKGKFIGFKKGILRNAWEKKEKEDNERGGKAIYCVVER